MDLDKGIGRERLFFMETEIPDIFNSKIKKLRIELPDYNFSHSSSGDSPHTFIGRVRVLEKLKKVIEDSPDEPGVYLVAGNRGVGKTSLVSEVIKKTSLQHKSKFTQNLIYIILLLLDSIGTLFCLQIFNTPENHFIILGIASFFIFILTFFLLCFNGYGIGIPDQKDENQKKTIWKFFMDKTINYVTFVFKGIRNYIKNHNRLYLRINFGHKLKDEKDILRLIARTLSTEYNRFHHSLRCMLPWRSITFAFLLLFSFFTSKIVREQYFYKSIEGIVEQQEFDKIIRDKELLKNYFFFDSDKIKTTSDTVAENTAGTKLGTKIFILLFVLDQFIKNFGIRINYLFLLSFFLIYLFFVLLFRCTWITQFFVTHQIVKRRLKKLNSDITHSTERENSLNMNNGSTGLGIGAKTKKSRNVADAREIEKELQDILNEIKRIPVIMCRPNIVIVFDELDKVEPGDSSIEKENIQTKASLFSIHATRERQTEILKILSNMKYFLSTARAKFIFIAGREVFDIHLADVSERNNYIGSIFNIVILVPSFLTDHHTGEKYLHQESSIASLPEEFVCRRLFPFDYHVDSYNLKNYRNYLRIMMIFEATQNEEQKKEIENKMNRQKDDIIISIENEEIKQVNKLIGQNEKIEQKISSIIPNVENEKIQRIYDIFIGQIGKDEVELEIKKIIPKVDEKRYKLICDMFTEYLKKIEPIKGIITKTNLEIKQKLGLEIPLVKKEEEIDQKINEKKKIIKDIMDKITIANNENVEQKIIVIITERNKEITQRIQNIFDDIQQEKIQKIIALLQQFIIYLAHVSKGAPKKMMQLFESFVEIHIENKENKENTLFVQRYHNSSQHFLSFNYYKQYTLGIMAYLITPIFYRLAESNIKEHSDKLLVSSLRFVDFLFKFHKHSFSWKILDISPEMLEVNRAPELKSVAVDLLNYLTQIHISKSNFSFSDYKFDSWIANEIFAMTKTDEVFSALFSFSLDEMLPLKKHYQDLLENTKKEYINDKNSSVITDAISSLQVVLGDLCYYNDELEEAEVYYKSAVQEFRKFEQKNSDKTEKKDREKEGKINHERLYVYVRNMLRLGMIYEKRKQNDFAYLIYSELCERIIWERDTANDANRIWFKKLTYEGLKMLYLPFIAKLQILEKSPFGGITNNHLSQLYKDFESLTKNIDPDGAKLIKAEFYSRVADILYYKNSDLNDTKDKKNSSCKACEYYRNALSALLNKNNTIDLLHECIGQINDNFNMKFCTILARILSDWGNVFFSCDISNIEKSEYINKNNEEKKCRIYSGKDRNTISSSKHNDFPNSFIEYIIYLKDIEDENSPQVNQLETKKDIALAMYSISSLAYRKAGLYKRSAYQIYKILCLFKDYGIYEYDKSMEFINELSEQAIHYL